MFSLKVYILVINGEDLTAVEMIPYGFATSLIHEQYHPTTRISFIYKEYFLSIYFSVTARYFLKQTYSKFSFIYIELCLFSF